MTKTFDVAVVGGGLAGMAAAVTAARTGRSVAHLAPAASEDRRTSALMMPTVDFLKGEGLIEDPAEIGVPLTAIRIIDATSRLLRAPETTFVAAEAGLDAFGWNFPNARLLKHFEEAAQSLPNLHRVAATLTAMSPGSDGHELVCGDGQTLWAALVVGADGKRSFVRETEGINVRERRFDQSALVADLLLERPLDGASVEFHYENGPFTLVPAGGKKANLVWIDRGDLLAEHKQMARDALADRLCAKSQRLFGKIELASPAFVFPLSTLSVATAGLGGVVLVGEAAHAFPPIGAQGLNLGLRDTKDLAAALQAHSGKASRDWALDVSGDYARRRARDLAQTGAFVDMLFRSLLAEMLPAQVLRAGGLWTLKMLPELRKQAFSLGMGERA